MTIQEKAKAYDEAIERAKNVLLDCTQEEQKVVEYIVSELNESEDERIRKALMKLVKKAGEGYENVIDGVSIENAISWLEKQGEQKPTDKVKPKFHEGEWVFIEEVKGYKNGPFQIKTVDSFGYSFDEYHTIPFMYEDLLSKWTIQDAKDGDVLSYRGGQWIFIYKQGEETAIEYHALVSENGLTINDVAFTALVSWIVPATKEQRDFLFKKMKEAGYKWNAEKKELKKIEQKPTDKYEPMSLDEAIEHCKEKSCVNNACALEHKQLEKWLTELKELKEQKPWNEEDETGLTNTIIMLKEGASLHFNKKDITKSVDFLNSLKDRYTWKPSDEQMKQLGWIAEQNKDNLIGKELMTLYQDLKKLREE